MKQQCRRTQARAWQAGAGGFAICKQLETVERAAAAIRAHPIPLQDA
jgi:hypothetical protein